MGEYSVGDIRFSLEQRQRHSLAIEVLPGQRVRVLAPWGISIREVFSLVAKHRSWIERKLQELETYTFERSLEYREGETMMVLGKPYTLRCSPDQKGVLLREQEGLLCLGVPRGVDRERRKKILVEWYRHKGREIFDQRLTYCAQRSKPLGIPGKPSWTVRKMRRRWGSCSSLGRITLNLELLAAPLECIDYVIYHELCHLLELNHSPQFYSLLERVCPDWRILAKRLNRNGPPLFI